MIWAAGELYGFEFHQIDNVPVSHPDIRVWEVTTRTANTSGCGISTRTLDAASGQARG